MFTLLSISEKIENLRLDQKHKEKTLSKKEFENNELMKQLDFMKIEIKKNIIENDSKYEKISSSKHQSAKKPR